MKCETVRVIADTDTGFKVINKSDFDNKDYKLFDNIQKAKKNEAKQDSVSISETIQIF